MKYIDSEKLMAEIERLKERAQAERVLHPKTILAARNYLLIQDYDNLLSFITSLQQEQPEVDLEKEIVLNYAHEHYYYDKDFDGYGHSKFRPVFTRDDLIGFARHFWSKGYNARKEESVSIAESPSKTFPRVNEFDCGSSYRH